MQLWNAAVTHRPAEVVTCRNVDDVRSALGRGSPLSVRGGGHDWAGRAIRPGGLMLDLSGMREVTVEGDVATAAGGATLLEVMTAAQTTGQAVVAGSVGAVGLAGLALGGGYGPLMGRAGLAADNIVGADVVLADGTLVRDDPDLLWALRGGGGNFGVVTALRLRLQPVATVLAGHVMFGLGQARDVLTGLGAILGELPDDLTLSCGILCAPDGTPLLFVGPTWAGEPAAGREWIARIEALGRPVANTVAVVAPTVPLERGDAMFAPDGRHYAIRTVNVEALPIDALLAGEAARTSPLSMLNMHHFHGAAARVPVEATAFGLRRDHLMVEIIGAWRPGDGTRDSGWADQVAELMRPSALPGGYPNLLGPDHHEQIRDAYGPNAHRLRELKQRFDPDGVFAAIPLP
ncbi:FAD-binding oxidoreductase [Actinoplanes sp. NPDC049265]|uniref:FAD-binding oxidoreductase n=1 Tax=Actinoplanes sp. NPDC049265 TaxID=3363902 RepID=UPI003713E56D